MSESKKKGGKVGCVIALVLTAIFSAGMIYLFFFHMKTTEIYKCAVSEAARNPIIAEKIGTPVETGFWVWMDNYSWGRFSESAHFSLSLSGPKGSGTLYVRAFKDIQFSSMDLIFEKDGREEVVRSGVYPCSGNYE